MHACMHIEPGNGIDVPVVSEEHSTLELDTVESISPNETRRKIAATSTYCSI
jgi:hypothetical protein